jgi:hypothetical protein
MFLSARSRTIVGMLRTVDLKKSIATGDHHAAGLPSSSTVACDRRWKSFRRAAIGGQV